MAVGVENRAALAAVNGSAMKPSTGLHASFHGEVSRAPHKMHKNGWSVQGSDILFFPLTEITSAAPPLREPQAIPTRDELFIATTGLYRSFEKVFDQTYTGGRSNKSFIGMAVEVVVNQEAENGGKAEWTVHHSPMNEGGEYVRLIRKTAAYNGYDEISEVSFVKPDDARGHLKPSITFTSHLQEKVPNADGMYERFEFVSPGQNTHESWDGAVQLLHDFAEIADLPRDQVSFNTVASRSPVVAQDEVRKKRDKNITDLVAGVESRLPVQRADGSWTDRRNLVTEAQQGEPEGLDESKRARHISGASVIRHAEDLALIGRTIYDRTPEPRKERPLITFSDEGETALIEGFGKEYVTNLNLVTVDNAVNTGQNNRKKPAPTISEAIIIDENKKDKEVSVRVYDTSAIAGPFGFPVTEPHFETIVDKDTRYPVSSDDVRMIIQIDANKRVTTYAVVGNDLFKANKEQGSGAVALTPLTAENAFNVSRQARKAAEQFLQKEKTSKS